MKNIPFRKSHEIVGQVVKYAEEKKVKLDQFSLEELKKINPIFDESSLKIFQIKDALSRKKTIGSPNPELVLKQINHVER